jgi:hypothetical protein
MTKLPEADPNWPTHHMSKSRGLIRIDSMHSAHSWNTADELERAGDPEHTETILAMRHHAQRQYDEWATANPEDAAKANAKRVEKGLEPRRVSGE